MVELCCEYLSVLIFFLRGNGRGWIKMMNDCDVFVKFIVSLLKEQSQFMHRYHFFEKVNKNER